MGRYDGLSTGALLTGVRGTLDRMRDAQLDQYLMILAWAEENIVSDVEVAATAWAGYLDTGMPLAGDGAPLVSEFAAMELIAVLGRSPESGTGYLGQCLELGWRLPRCHDQVLAGKVKLYKALAVADQTRSLPAAAAEYVDRHLAFALATCTWAQVDRLVHEAMTRFDPEAAEERRKAANELRRFDVDPIDQNGLASISGVMDAADAKDLDAAVARRAKALGKLGCEESLDVRRSMAAGELARDDLALDLEALDENTGELRTVAKGRRIVLNVHISEAALTDTRGSSDGCVGRWADARTPISPEQIKTWITSPGQPGQHTTVIVRPVVDLQDHVPVGSYEIPDRLRTRVELRDQHCIHPHCTKPAARCDLDHREPHADGGVTCPCNLAPICRSHHRAKTHAKRPDGSPAWSYVTITPGTYLWRSPNDQFFLVDHTGTRQLDHPRQWNHCPGADDPPDAADPPDE